MEDRYRAMSAVGVRNIAGYNEKLIETARKGGALTRKVQTGIDPETARAVGLATEHARGLMTALSTLSTAAQAAPVLGALRPVIAPLTRLLGEIEQGENEGAPEGGTEGEP